MTYAFVTTSQNEVSICEIQLISLLKCQSTMLQLQLWWVQTLHGVYFPPLFTLEITHIFLFSPLCSPTSTYLSFNYHMLCFADSYPVSNPPRAQLVNSFQRFPSFQIVNLEATRGENQIIHNVWIGNRW